MMERVREAKEQLYKAYHTEDWEWIIQCQMVLSETISAERTKLASDLCEFAKDYDWFDYRDNCDSDEDAIREIMCSLTDAEEAEGIIKYLVDVINEAESATEKVFAQDLVERVADYGKEMGLWKDVLMTNSAN